MSSSLEIKTYVIDTNALIFYFSEVFEQNSLLSEKIEIIMRRAIDDLDPYTKLFIPSIVFIEIFSKWLLTEEFARKFYYEVFNKLKLSENVFFIEIDVEVIRFMTKIEGNLENHDIHDKLILATAIKLNAPLITSDSEINKYIINTKSIPLV